MEEAPETKRRRRAVIKYGEEGFDKAWEDALRARRELFLSRLRPFKSRVANATQDVPRIQNVVGTGKLGTTFDPKKAAGHWTFGFFSPSSFAAEVCQFSTHDRGTMLAFSQKGKIVLVGNVSVPGMRTSHQHMRMAVDALPGCTETGPTCIKGLKCHNIVFNFRVKSRIRMNALANDFPFALYVPDVFPGMILYHMITKTRCAVYLLFAEGKVICMGIRSLNEVREAYVRILKLLYLYREETAGENDEAKNSAATHATGATRDACFDPSFRTMIDRTIRGITKDKKCDIVAMYRRLIDLCEAQADIIMKHYSAFKKGEKVVDEPTPVAPKMPAKRGRKPKNAPVAQRKELIYAKFDHAQFSNAITRMEKLKKDFSEHMTAAAKALAAEATAVAASDTAATQVDGASSSTSPFSVPMVENLLEPITGDSEGAFFRMVDTMLKIDDDGGKDVRAVETNKVIDTDFVDVVPMRPLEIAADSSKCNSEFARRMMERAMSSYSILTNIVMYSLQSMKRQDLRWHGWDLFREQWMYPGGKADTSIYESVLSFGMVLHDDGLKTIANNEPLRGDSDEILCVDPDDIRTLVSNFLPSHSVAALRFGSKGVLDLAQRGISEYIPEKYKQWLARM